MIMHNFLQKKFGWRIVALFITIYIHLKTFKLDVKQNIVVVASLK